MQQPQDFVRGTVIKVTADMKTRINQMKRNINQDKLSCPDGLANVEIVSKETNCQKKLIN